MKKYSFYYLFALSLFLVDCSPKMTEEVQKTPASTESFRSKAPNPGPAPKINVGSYDIVQLENGLKVIVVENHKLPRVSFTLNLDRDAIFEGDNAGYVSIAGQMLDKGTKTRTKAEIDQAIDFMGANLGTGPTRIFASSLVKHKESLLAIMSDVLMNPAFPVDEFDKIKKQTISGLQTEKDDPNAIARKMSRKLAYGAMHPYGESDTESTIEAISLDDCKAYYDKFFKPNIAYLVVVGDITSAEVKPLAQKYFGGWKSGKVPAYNYDFPASPEASKVSFVNRPGAVQSVINITYPVDLKPGADDEIKTSVLNTLVGGFFNSRFNQNLREDKGYTYGARSSLSTDDLVSAFNAFASVRNEVTDSSVIEFLFEMNRIRNEKVAEDELTLVKNYMSGSFARSLERPETVANFAMNTFLYNLPKDYYETYLEKLNAVSVDDVMQMAKKYIHPDNAHIVVVGNKSEVADNLKGFSPDEKIDFYDVDGNYMKPVEGNVGNVNPMDVINGYVVAIGGADNLNAVKALHQEIGISVMGQEMSVEVYKKRPGKMAVITSAMGMTISKQVWNGETGYVEQQGQKMDADDTMKGQFEKDAKFFSEMDYGQDGYVLVFQGLENIDGTPAYVIEVTSPNGDKSIEYYDKETYLKVKEVSTSDQMGQSTTVTTTYGNYKEVSGVKIPHSMKATGMAPVPLEMTVKSITINGDIDDAKFN